MSDPTSAITCRDCGAENPAGRTQCWLCNAPLKAPAPADESPLAKEGAAPPKFVRSGAARTFGLDSLFLIITLAAVLLGILSQAPGWGALFAAAAVPAVVRTVMLQGRLKQQGRPMDVAQKIVTFLGSFGVAALATVAAIIVFVATCFPTGFLAFSAESEPGFVMAWVFGFAAGGAAFFFILRAFWRRRKI
ncbi:MAG: hypothetical protein KY475_15910 [Planctomycetes bacterium]|nr:hypothetical protein [Planctomycetota bacterium]